MAPKFNFDPAKDIPDLTGRVLLITGGTSGIGRTAIEQLLPHKPRAIYFTGRNQAAADSVVSAAASSSTAVHFLKCDLASLASVKKCAADFLAQSDRLDVLICNAGIMTVPPALTDDGYEAQWGTNHMGHALLINLLLPVLKATVSKPVPADGQSDKADVRVLILTSLAARATNPHREGIDLNDLSNPTVTGYSYPHLLPVLSPWVAYGRSKLANLLYAQELARRLVDDGILVVAVHPGVVMTNLVNGQGWFNRWLVKLTTIGNQIEPEQGSWNMLWALSAPRKRMESGKKCTENWGAEKGQVVSGGVYEPVGVPSYVLGSMTWSQEDNDLKKRLWEWTAKELERWIA